MLIRIVFLMLTAFSITTIDAVAEEQKTPDLAKATFAGGCFWCMVQPYEILPGVLNVVSGYTGGDKKNPTYKQVSSGKTGHFEAVQIQYDPRVISYEKLLAVFWRNIDPTNDKGQFCDEGSQYRSAIFYHDDEQKRFAELSKEKLEKHKLFPEPIVTLIIPASNFYPAEDYHQYYYRKKPLAYKFYRFTCGRDSRLDTLWRDDKAIFQSSEADS